MTQLGVSLIIKKKMQLAERVVDDSWKVVGYDSQVLTVNLKPGECLVCEPGAMISHDDYIEPAVIIGWGLWDMIVRFFWGGEKILQDKYVNESFEACQSVTLSVPFPGGKILPVLMGKITSMIISPGAWLACRGSDVQFDVTLVKSLYSGIFAGRGFVLTNIRGKSTCFLCGGGTILERTLRNKESIVVDESSFLACESTVEIRARRAGSLCTMLFGGEGAFNCLLTGPGKVYLQSMPHVAAKAKGIKSYK